MRKLIITGMPRSGTSWLGQIINSAPQVLFRTEPLFAYRFKNIINKESTWHEINEFFDALLDVDDDFILQKENQKAGYYPEFEKTNPQVLAFKTTRHHELIERYLECVSELDVIAIIRHPCAAINSWFKSYREFEKKGCQQKRDWRTGGCRKKEIGEYWGFNDWLLTTSRYVQLAKQFPNVRLIRYADLVEEPNKIITDLFDGLGYDLHPQTLQFLEDCHQRHDSDPYSVFKSKQVVDSWKTELDEKIAAEISHDTEQHGLGQFL